MIGDALIYCGNSFYDKGISWLTRSPFDHIAFDLGDGMLIEAYPGIGVRKRIYMDNEPGLSRFRLKEYKENEPRFHIMRAWLETQIGKSYDFPGILGFALDNPDIHDKNKWFCSELFVVAYEVGGIPLFNKKEYFIAPGDIASNILFEKIDNDREAL